METIEIAHAGLGFWEWDRARETLETAVLPHYVPGCRWFGGKARTGQRFQLEQTIALGPAPEAPRLLLVRVEYAEGPGETYLLPVVLRAGEGEPIATFADGQILVEATGEESFREAFMQLLAGEKTLRTDGGAVRGERGPGLPDEAELLPSRVLKAEQSNSSLIYGDEVFVKLFRKLEDGMNPDVEITRFLNERQCACVPPFAGALLLERGGREPQVLALALGMVPNEGDAWTQTLGEVRRFYERVLEVSPEARPGDSDRLRALAGDYVERVRQLGVRTGEVHQALASAPAGDPFAREPITPDDQRELAAGIGKSIEQVFSLLAQSQDPLAASLAARKAEVAALATKVGAAPGQGLKTRTHGDYHLGQVLNTGSDYVIIDFEGEPQRSLAERQKKRSPLRDVAGMLRSFHYAAHSGLGEFPEARERLTPWAEAWASLMQTTFWQSWLATCAGDIIPAGEEAQAQALLQAFLLEKAIYEVGYELNNRPTWVGIPVRGILQILAG